MEDSTHYIQVATAIDSEEGALKIADALVSRHLAACVHIWPLTSMYWWQGKKETAREWLCTAKTRRELYEQVERCIRENHPYEVPEVLATPVLDGSQEYLEWIDAETAQP